MSKLRIVVLASVIGLFATSAASAAVFAPQIPNPANPHPAFPVATDGTPLPPMGWAWDEQTSYAVIPPADTY